MRSVLALVGLFACGGPAPARDEAVEAVPIDPASVACGELTDTRDDAGVLLALGQGGDTPAIEVLDPMSGPSRDLERRLKAAGLDARLDLRVLLMPLDPVCNWVVNERINPGACTVSVAILCAEHSGSARQVLEWAFEQQDAIRAAAELDPMAAQQMIGRRFPELADCIDSPAARARLNKALRWSVERDLQIVVPQLWIRGTRLCAEAHDERLEAAVKALIER